jgi:hypothetical protein
MPRKNPRVQALLLFEATKRTKQKKNTRRSLLEEQEKHEDAAQRSQRVWEVENRRCLALAGQLEEAVAVARSCVGELERMREGEVEVEAWKERARRCVFSSQRAPNRF